MDANHQLSALGDPTRRSIYERLTRGPLSVGSLSQGLPVSRPAVSQHLKVLTDAGLVTSTRDGTRRIYEARPEGIEELGRWLDRLWDQTLDRFEEAAERMSRMTTTVGIQPVIKVRTVPLPPQEAFRLFTELADTWWPLETHSIGAYEDQIPVALRFEGYVGGRVIEVAADGAECSWADVLAWQPPYRFALSWHPNREPKAASTLEVRFTAVAEGTEVYLEHRGWEEFGDEGQELRDGYDTGWDIVLSPFEAVAG
jgi:DNA-binding transcriptional ArsR family regulator/uncharacterized protein YndB with AHSA1/START domain